jgi:hypothetical protein
LTAFARLTSHCDEISAGAERGVGIGVPADEVVMPKFTVVFELSETETGFVVVS